MFITRRRYSRGRLAKRRFSAFLLFIIGVVLSFVAAVSVASFVSSRDAIAITNVSIKGAVTVPVHDLEAFVREKIEGSYFLLFPRRSAVLYPRGAIEAGALAAFPRIEQADVRLDDFHTVTLSVIEREPYALWCDDAANILDNEAGAACYFLDHTGFIYADASDFSGDTSVRFYGALFGRQGDSTDMSPAGRHFLSGEEFRTFVFLLNALADLELSATSLAVLNDHDFEVTLESGLRLIMRRDSDMPLLVSSIEAAFRSDEITNSLSLLEYIDFRFGNKVYYK